MSKSTKVSSLPNCDLGCKRRDGAPKPAYADASIATLNGSWGYVCKDCFKRFGCHLGLGLGQKLILITDPPSDHFNNTKAILEGLFGKGGN